MKPIPRAVIFYLCFTLALPNPAWALRPELDRSALEERFQPAAGMEEYAIDWQQPPIKLEKTHTIEAANGQMFLLVHSFNEPYLLLRVEQKRIAVLKQGEGFEGRPFEGFFRVDPLAWLRAPRGQAVLQKFSGDEIWIVRISNTLTFKRENAPIGFAAPIGFLFPVKPLSADPSAGMEEVSPAFLAYEQRLKQRINSEGVFQVELDERGLLQKLILRGTEVLYDAEAEFSSSGEFKFSYGQIMPLRLLVYTAEDGLLTMHAEQGAFFHYHADSSRRALELEVGVDVTEDNRQLLREMMDNIAAAGGAAEIEFQGPTLPNMSEILEQQVQIELVDGQGRWRIVGGQNGWIVSNLPPAAGMEERNVEGALAALAEGAQGAGVVVIGPEGLEVRAGLEEMVKRAPPELLHRMVFFAVGAVWAERLRQLNRGVRVIEKDDLNALIPILLAMPEADRVAVLGWLALAQRLERVVPPSITVSFLDMNAAFRLILAAMGVPAALLDQIDAVGLEEQLARRRSA